MIMKKDIMKILATCLLAGLFISQISLAQNLQRSFPRNEISSPAFTPKKFTGRLNTVRVLALRVQFRVENPDYSGTTGNGWFDLRDLRDSLTIDPPPHNKRYFEDHLLAMKNYFHDVSDGMTDIQYTVKPDGINDAYTLNEYMYHYGITGSQSIRDVRLAKLFKDAVTKADTSDTIDFSQYDHILVFHAGAGQDFSNRDNTPNDLSSRFITYDLLKKYDTSSAFTGIPVNNGTIRIKNGVVVPETESQYLVDPVFQTDVFQEIGLSGILIANFGSQLGMPDLFDTDNGRPAIGMFGLEDQGAMNGNGLIPSEPDPWTKIYMGWAKPVILSDSTGFPLYPKKLVGHNTIYKLPINDHEYFLIENRQKDVLDNSLFPVILSRIDTVTENGTTIIDTVYLAGAEQSGDTKVFTRIDEYDAGLPGRGVLVWHIDDRVIQNQWSSNSINNDPNNRGIRLVEASGSQDIGYAFSVGPFVSVNAGDRWDFFFKGNIYFKYFNGNTDSVYFSSSSVPASTGKHRVISGFSLSDFSARLPVMTFDVRTSLLKKGFPQYTGTSFGTQSVTFGNITGDSKQEIIISVPSGNIYAWQADGQKVISNPMSVTHRRFGQDSVIYPLALFAQVPDSLIADPALADLDGDNVSELVTISKTGILTAWKGADANSDGLADTLWQKNLNGSFILPPVITPDKRIVIGSAGGMIFVFGSAGQLISQLAVNSLLLSMALINNDTLGFRTAENAGLFGLSGGTLSYFPGPRTAGSSMMVSGDLLRNGSRHVIVHDQSDGRHFLNSYPPAPGFPVVLNDPPSSPLSLADIDGDGFPEIIFGSNNKIYAFNHNGTLVTNFPVTLDASEPAGKIFTTVLISDVNNNELPDLIAGAEDGRIFAFDPKGNPVSGFPLSAGYPIRSSMAVMDMDQDNNLHIVAPSQDGFLYAWNTGAPYFSDRTPWPKIFRDAENSSRNTEQNAIPSPDDDWMPKKKAYCYPNPARGNETKIRYYLSEPATVKIRIFDLAGDQVARFEGSGVPMSDNEAVWNIRNIQSGVYFAKIEAKSSAGKKVTRTVKIAVTK